MANLITLADYKIAEGIQATKDDAKLELLVDSVSALVKTYCNNSFVDYYSTNNVEVFDILYNENFVQLTESPVRTDETITVQERTSTTVAYSTLTENTDYYVDTKTDSIVKVTGNFESGYGAVKVTYKAGYASTAIPKDLQLAVIDLITYYHKDEHKARQTIAGASIQNQGSTSQRNNVAFPDHIKRVLDLYKNF
jgi:hypothetical protein